jgi:hypothetical protein
MGFGLSPITHTNAKGGTKMNCEHCGKEMYNTPVDGWFHKREQDAIDCYRQLWRKRNRKTPLDQRDICPKCKERINDDMGHMCP